MRQARTEGSTTMTDPTATPTGTSASDEFDRLFGEASDILARLGHALADGEWPAGLTWADAGDMGRLVADLRAISDYVFAEGEHAPDSD
jgi:hypothetical protein